MLQSMTTERQSFQSDESAAAATLAKEAAALQEQLLDRGTFRKFLEVPAAKGSGVQLACGSPSFTSAASNFIRYTQMRSCFACLALSKNEVLLRGDIHTHTSANWPSKDRRSCS